MKTWIDPRAGGGFSPDSLCEHANRRKYKVSHRNLGGCFRNLHSGYYDDFRKDVLAKAAWPEDWETIHGSLRLHEISRFFVKLGGIFETELRLETGEGYRWVRLRLTQLRSRTQSPASCPFHSRIFTKRRAGASR